MIKREYIVVFAIALFLFAYILDLIAPDFKIVLKNPYQFLDINIIETYPFTSFSIGVRSLAIFVTVIVTFALIKGQYLIKGAGMLLISALSQLYAIQQLVTGQYGVDKAGLLSLQWLLSISMGGLLLVIPGVIFVVFGFIYWGHSQFSGNIYEVEGEDPNSEE
jgi:hypothetical protein